MTIPANIAPMNFDLSEKDVENALTIVSIVDVDGKVIRENATSFSGKKIRFSKKFWKKTLRENIGRALRFS
ncbi:MAG: hypothetical protein J6X44_03160, partial [Thermoguttaceae bacterium]|nr:hypothetical protein [Thermoguttaceae bacterium]